MKIVELYDKIDALEVAMANTKIIKKIMQEIFSIKNKGEHKIIQFLGLQLKIRRKR